MLKLNKTVRMLVFATTVSVMTTYLVPDQSNAETLVEVNQLLSKANDGDSEALDSAIEILEKLKFEQPENAQVLAYLGSAYGLRADQSWNPLKKGEFGNISLRYLDIALEMAPEDFEVRKNRAIVNMAVPFFLGRKDEGIDDLIVLDRLFRESPTPELAKEMLAFQFYDTLIEEASDRGDWSEGKTLAEKLAQ